MVKTKDLKIGVLMGGPSRERQISLISGKMILQSLLRQGYNAIPIIDPNEDIFKKLNGIDVAYLALHGSFGEDGRIQGLLEALNIPYTGSGVLASALAMNKVLSKRIFESVNIPTPRYYYINKYNSLEDEIQRCITKLKAKKYVVKPVSEGSSIGISIVEEVDLKEAVKQTQEEFKDIFVEEYIEGMNTTVGILGVEPDIVALPIIELVPKISDFYDYKAKYTEGGTELIIPARLNEDVYKYTQQVALKAHKALNCFSVSRVDIIVKDGVPYITEINTLPGMTQLSDLPKAAQAYGISFDELVRIILEHALLKKHGR
jgi:D-alanine-D-alanine ligase